MNLVVTYKLPGVRQGHCRGCDSYQPQQEIVAVVWQQPQDLLLWQSFVPPPILILDAFPFKT